MSLYSRLDVLRYLRVVEELDRGLWQSRRISRHNGNNSDPIQLSLEITELELRICDRPSVGTQHRDRSPICLRGLELNRTCLRNANRGLGGYCASCVGADQVKGSDRRAAVLGGDVGLMASKHVIQSHAGGGVFDSLRINIAVPSQHGSLFGGNERVAKIGTYGRADGAKNADVVIASIEVAEDEAVVGRGDGAELR